MIRRKRERKPYFAEREENAVVQYIYTDSVEEKHRLYNEVLKSPFTKMVESILRKYPFHKGNYEIEEIEANAMSHLVEQMVKFNPEKITKSGKKAKAFSYCQTIVRNFYKDHSKKSFNEKVSNLPWEDYSDEINKKKDYIRTHRRVEPGLPLSRPIILSPIF